VVVDASAILAVLLDEPRAELIESRLPGSLMSVVNLAEVLSHLDRREHDPVRARTALRRLAIHPIAADEPLAFRAAHLHSHTRSHGLSLADCFCLALAQERKAEVLTADRAWKGVHLGVPITLVRE
jgi:PIN domain nuclease of toxin-antitoxin system